MANKAAMKLERTGTSAQSERRATDDAAQLASAAASILGIPEKEFTPKVREALTALMVEMEDLRSELRAMRERLDQAEKNADRRQLLPLLNRRAFMRQLTRYISFADRYGTA